MKAPFSPIGPEDPGFGHLVETSIYAQWFHGDRQLYYARWTKGEVDIVALSPTQKPTWAAEINYSDRYYADVRELKNLLAFVRDHQLPRAVVTTISKGGVRAFEGCQLDFIPASLYCYAVGRSAVVGKRLADVTRGLEPPDPPPSTNRVES